MRGVPQPSWSAARLLTQISLDICLVDVIHSLLSEGNKAGERHNEHRLWPCVNAKRIVSTPGTSRRELQS
jgi:hypothetical protein